MKVAVQIVCVLLYLGVTLYTESKSLSQLMGYSKRQARYCEGRHCRFAVCQDRTPLVVNDEFCDFMNAPCECESGTTCRDYNNRDPDVGATVVYFGCKPAELYFT